MIPFLIAQIFSVLVVIGALAESGVNMSFPFVLVFIITLFLGRKFAHSLKYRNISMYSLIMLALTSFIALLYNDFHNVFSVLILSLVSVCAVYLIPIAIGKKSSTIWLTKGSN